MLDNLESCKPSMSVAIADESMYGTCSKSIIILLGLESKIGRIALLNSVDLLKSISLDSVGVDHD